MNKKHVFLFLTLFIPSSLFAQGWYVGGGAGLVDFDDAGISYSPLNAYAKGGYAFNQYIDVGLEASATIIPDEISSIDIAVNIVTFFLRAGLPIDDTARIYAQIGQSNTELSLTIGNVEGSIDDTDSSIAFGIEINLGNQNSYVDINYSSYFDGIFEGIAPAEATAINIGIGARF